MSNVIPLNYASISWMVSQINNHLSGEGFVVGIAVDKENNVIGAKCLPVGFALENGFVPVQVVDEPNPEPPKTANG